MAKEIDIGAYSAYAIAVEHGYEGTEEEFARQLTDSAANGALAQDGAERTEAALEELQIAIGSIPEEYGELSARAVRNSKSIEQVNGVKQIVFESGYFDLKIEGTVIDITNRATSSTGMVSGVAECVPGDVISLNIDGAGSASGGARAYAFLNAEKEIILRANVNSSLLNKTMVVPDGAAYVVLNTKSVDIDYYAYIGRLTTDILKESTLKSHNTPINDAESFVAPYDDCNTVPHNSIVCYIGAAQLPNNAPTRDMGSSANVLTYNYISKESLPGGAVQIWMDSKDYCAIRYKVTNSRWNDWKQLSPKPAFNNFPALSMFPKIGVIGDSWASGQISLTATEYTPDSFHVSWPQIAARNYGIEAENFSHGGLKTETWLTHSNGLSKLQNAEAQDLYICALGINDCAKRVEIGLIDDIENGANTFYGYYGRIIRAIKEKAPSAMIAIATIPQYNASAAIEPYNEAIAEIAEAFGIPMLNLMEDELFQSEFFSENLFYNHPSIPVYSAIAEAYNRLIAKSCMENPAYWNQYTWPY